MCVLGEGEGREGREKCELGRETQSGEGGGGSKCKLGRGTQRRRGERGRRKGDEEEKKWDLPIHLLTRSFDHAHPLTPLPTPPLPTLTCYPLPHYPLPHYPLSLVTHSPTTHSPTTHSPTTHSPTTHSHLLPTRCRQCQHCRWESLV